MAFCITWLITRPTKPVELANKITEHRFPTICFFLGVFLCVPYLLSFALAFHDKGVRKANSNSFALDAGSERNPPSDQTANQQKAGASDAQANQSTEILTILFAEGFASADIDMGLTPNELYNRYHNDQEKYRRIMHNNEAMTKIIKQIHQYETNQRIRITLVGHSNDIPITIEGRTTRYKSNYELSDARARQVLLHLTEELGKVPEAGQRSGAQWHNIEWLLAPISNEETFIGETPQISSDKLCVEVSITPITAHLTQRQMQALEQMKPQSPPPRKLELLDYIYFTIYTITTTGYGDIKPVTGYAKFVVSLANLFEVFFLVIFFNALISSRLPQNLSELPQTNSQKSTE